MLPIWKNLVESLVGPVNEGLLFLGDEGFGLGGFCVNADESHHLVPALVVAKNELVIVQPLFQTRHRKGVGGASPYGPPASDIVGSSGAVGIDPSALSRRY